MQPQSIESEYQVQEDRSADITQFKFRVLFGEFCVMEKIFDGQTIKPNIFANDSAPGLKKLYDSCASYHIHVISALYGSNQSIGISTNENRIIYTYKIFNRMYVEVSGDYQAYLKNFRKKSLNSLNRKIKKAEKSNTTSTTILDFSEPNQVREFVDLAKPISALSYQEAQLGTVFRTDEEWISELETLARNNRFRGYVLNINDTPVAYNYCPIYGDGILLYDLSGYIPDYSQYSPGTVLQAHIIQQSFSDDTIKYYDLCEGEGRHKEQFATGSNTCFNAYIFPNTPYYRFLVLFHRALDQLSETIVGQLKRLGLKDKIKTILRRRS